LLPCPASFSGVQGTFFLINAINSIFLRRREHLIQVFIKPKRRFFQTLVFLIASSKEVITFSPRVM
jgi:hypothetical protein